MNKNDTQLKKGFTLIEIIVSLAIFSVVATVAAGALLKIMNANKKAQSIQSALTNLNYALESMSREMRVSSAFYCTNGMGDYTYNGSTPLPNQACTIGGNTAPNTYKSVIIKSTIQARAYGGTGSACSYNLLMGYRFATRSDADGIYHLMQKAEQPHPSGECNLGSSITSDDYTDIISATNVRITDYNFGVLYGDSPGYSQQYPFAFIRISGNAGVRDRGATYFDIQTAISSRVAQ